MNNVSEFSVVILSSGSADLDLSSLSDKDAEPVSPIGTAIALLFLCYAGRTPSPFTNDSPLDMMIGSSNVCC